MMGSWPRVLQLCTVGSSPMFLHYTVNLYIVQLHESWIFIIHQNLILGMTCYTMDFIYRPLIDVNVVSISLHKDILYMSDIYLYIIDRLAIPDKIRILKLIDRWTKKTRTKLVQSKINGYILEFALLKRTNRFLCFWITKCIKALWWDFKVFMKWNEKFVYNTKCFKQKIKEIDCVFIL